MNKRIFETTLFVVLTSVVAGIILTAYWYFYTNRSMEYLSATLFWGGAATLAIGAMLSGQTTHYWKTRTAIDPEDRYSKWYQLRLRARLWAQVIFLSGCLIIAVSFILTEWI